MLASIPHFLIHPNALDSFIQTNFHAGHFKGALTHAGNIGLWGSLVSRRPATSSTGSIKFTKTCRSGRCSRLYCSAHMRTFYALCILARPKPRQHASPQPVDDHLFSRLQRRLGTPLRVSSTVLIALYLTQLGYAFALSYTARSLCQRPSSFSIFNRGCMARLIPSAWNAATSVIYRSAKLTPTIALWVYIARQLWHPTCSSGNRRAK